MYNQKLLLTPVTGESSEQSDSGSWDAKSDEWKKLPPKLLSFRVNFNLKCDAMLQAVRTFAFGKWHLLKLWNPKFGIKIDPKHWETKARRRTDRLVADSVVFCLSNLFPNF